MTMTSEESHALWRHVERTRRQDELDREPYLRLFRASTGETAEKTLEAERMAEGATAAVSPEHTAIFQFAEGIAQCGREEVRFQRWLDWNLSRWRPSCDGEQAKTWH